MDWRKYSLEIIKAVKEKRISNAGELNELKLKLAKKFEMKEVPSNPTILSFAGKKEKKLVELLSIKPIRSMSGVAIVSLMPKPFDCPGKCIYCPSSVLGNLKVPKSYTGREPATMRALSNKFNPKKQILNRIEQLNATGHSTEKIDLIVMGGTFLSTPLPFQKNFMKECFEASSGKKARTLKEAQLYAEKSRNRIVGINFETRPDYCGKKEINRMLSFGGTRVELGVQNIDDEIYKKISRNHSVQDVIEATALLKDSAFKVCYHLMPGLPYSDKKKDLRMFRQIFSNPDFKPDMLKIYPCIVIKGTKLYDLWKQGKFSPLSTMQATELVAEAKKYFPKWVRVMRVQRDIPSTIVEAGVKNTNLRQFVEEKMKEKGIKCNCIRCREAGRKIQELTDLIEPEILVEEFNASGGREIFISAEDKKNDLLYGFCRMRIPFKPFRKEITEGTALIRELHVYTKALPLGKKPSQKEFQHRGLGKSLLGKAEEIALQEFSSKKILVLSGIGVKEYYRKQGYKNEGPYVSKKL